MIESLNQAGQAWWLWMAGMFWQVGILIVLVGAADWLLKRWAWPQVRYALWLLVLIKLALPPGLSSPMSVTSRLGELAGQVQVVAPVIPVGETQKQLLLPLVDNRLAVRNDIVNSKSDSSPWAADKQAGPIDKQTNPAAAITPPMNVGESVSLKWPVYAMGGWLAGVLTLAGWLAVRWGRLERQFKAGAVEATPKWFSELLEQTSRRVGLKRTPGVVLSRTVRSPAVYGVFRPVLLMPAEKMDRLSRADVAHILLHEMSHIKRSDLIVHAISVILQIIYWFNPLLWWVRKQLHHLRELCCDATVARMLREKTSDYRTTLLEAARALLAEKTEVGVGLLGLFEDANKLLARLNWLERKPWRHRKLRIAAALAVVAVMFACVLPMAKAEQTETNSTNIPSGFVGHWTGQSKIIVNWCKRPTLNIDIDIRPDGSVTGAVGDTTLKDAKLKPNRGAIQKKLNWATDWMIQGDLAGPIIKDEEIQRDSINLLFNDLGDDGKIKGGFHTSGWHAAGGKNHMVLSGSDMVLEKTASNTSQANKTEAAMIGTWFFDNPGGDDEQMAIFPDGKIVVIYSNGHKDETYYKEGFVELAEYDNAKFKLSIGKEGMLLQTNQVDSGQSIEIAATKKWKRLSDKPQTELLKPLTQANVEKPAGRDEEGKDKTGISTDNADGRYVATLSNGVTVELVGVCEHPSEGKQWWRPDGTILESPLITLKKNPSGMPTDKTFYLFAMRILPLSEPVCVSWEFSREGAEWAYWPPGLSDKSWPEGFCGQLTNFSPGQNVTDIHFKISPESGFKTPNKLGMTPGQIQRQADSRIIYDSGWAAFTLVMFNDPSNPQLLVVDNLLSFQRRVVAVDPSGRLHLDSGWGLGPIHDLSSTTFLHDGLRRGYSNFSLPLSAISVFQVQFSPYEEVIFKNVSLRPGVKTAVEVSAMAQESPAAVETNTAKPTVSKLDFRIAPTKGGSEISDVEIATYHEQLVKNGPVFLDGEPAYRWFAMKDGSVAANCVTGQYQGRDYVLLHTQKPFVMLASEGWGVESVSSQKDQDGNPSLSLTLDRKGSDLLWQITGDNIKKPMAIVVDDEVISAPTIMSRVSHQVQITGKFTEDEIRKLAASLCAGMPAVQPWQQKQHTLENVGQVQTVQIPITNMFDSIEMKNADSVSINLFDLAVGKIIPLEVTLKGLIEPERNDRIFQAIMSAGGGDLILREPEPKNITDQELFLIRSGRFDLLTIEDFMQAGKYGLDNLAAHLRFRYEQKSKGAFIRIPSYDDDKMEQNEIGLLQTGDGVTALIQFGEYNAETKTRQMKYMILGRVDMNHQPEPKLIPELNKKPTTVSEPAKP